jgi:tRNA threonylcarbamoyl adenosine modification protein (Sua5/YciO/YrdC/YwlC family)
MLKMHMQDEGMMERAVEVLMRGGVAIMPTDTLYGFSASISCQSGVRRIMTIKGNGEERKFLFLAGDLSMVESYINSWGCADRELLEEIWPAPLTAIFPSGRNCPQWIGDTIALRIPNFPQLIRIIQTLGEPIVSTSVNRTGEPPMDSANLIEKRYGDKIDLFLIGDEVTGSRSSTIVDFTGKVPVLIREGSYPWELENGEPSNG